MLQAATMLRLLRADPRHAWVGPAGQSVPGWHCAISPADFEPCAAEFAASALRLRQSERAAERDGAANSCLLACSPWSKLRRAAAIGVEWQADAGWVGRAGRNGLGRCDTALIKREHWLRRQCVNRRKRTPSTSISTTPTTRLPHPPFPSWRHLVLPNGSYAARTTPPPLSTTACTPRLWPPGRRFVAWTGSVIHQHIHHLDSCTHLRRRRLSLPGTAPPTFLCPALRSGHGCDQRKRAPLSRLP